MHPELQCNLYLGEDLAEEVFEHDIPVVGIRNNLISREDLPCPERVDA